VISQFDDSCELCGGSGQLPEAIVTDSGSHHPVCPRCAALGRSNAVSDEIKDERMDTGLALLLAAGTVGLLAQSATGALLFAVLFVAWALRGIVEAGSFFSDWAEVLASLRKRPRRRRPGPETESSEKSDDGSPAAV
jgi:hypothetical protein